MLRVTKAIVWGSIGQISRIALKLSVTIYLAQVLEPKQFGLIAKVTIIINILNIISNFGLSTSLIQKKTPSINDYSTVFWTNTALGSILSILLIVCSPLIAKFYYSPELTGISKALSVTVLLNSTTIIQQVILNKQLKVKRLEIYGFSSNLLSASLGIYLAYRGYGVWSLVVQNISLAFFSFSLYWLFEPWKPLFLFDKRSFRQLSGYGSSMAASSILNTLFSSLDSILVGRYFSASVMGYYSYSQSLTKTISTVLVGPIYNIVLPIFSNVQADNNSLKETYKQFVGIVNFIILPIMSFIIVMAEELVYLVFEDKWSGLAHYLRFFAFITIIYNHSAINVSIISAKGKGSLFFKLEVLKKVILCSFLFAGIQYGLLAFLMGVLIHWILSLGVDIYFSGQISNYPWNHQIRNLLPNIFITVIYSIILGISKYYIFPVIPAALALPATGIVSGIAYVSLSYHLKLQSLDFARQFIKKSLFLTSNN